MAKAKIVNPYMSDPLIERFKKQFDFGNGVEVANATNDDKGNRAFDFYYTNKLPKLKIETHNVFRLVTVEASSIEADDKRLLHYLHTRMQK